MNCAEDILIADIEVEVCFTFDFVIAFHAVILFGMIICHLSFEYLLHVFRTRVSLFYKALSIKVGIT